jgi:uncharacterized hydrophobic protein (TIGR00271 family)
VLHLRLRVPEDLVDAVVDDLEADGTVTNVAMVPGAFRKPPGCLVLADVARESATSVIGRLRDLDLQHRGSISIDEIDTILSNEAFEAEQIAPGAPDDGVVWVSVEQRLRDDSRLSWAFVSFMTLAALIAGTGRILDQPILIVGAMVVGPEFSPIAAICFALAHPRFGMLPVAVRSLVTGFLLAGAVSTVVWTIAYRLGAFTREQAGTGELTDFIVSPDAWSFVVACLAGIAGTLSLTTAKSGPLVGVFISITTIPALGTIAVCLACGIWSEALSALTQLGINLLGIMLAGTLTLLVQRLVWRRVASSRLRRSLSHR